MYIESNEVGFYFVAYIPRTFKNYAVLRDLLRNGIIQGFSKMGWATDYEYKYKKDGSFDYMLIKRMEIIAMSLVAVPANAIGFEKVSEIVQYGLRFEKKEKRESGIDYMFN